MTMYCTHYTTPQGGFHSTSLFAMDLQHAEELMRRRRLGEHLCQDYPGGVNPYLQRPEMPSTLWRRGEYVQAAHAATWALMVLSRSNPDRMFLELCDDGGFHELMHEMHHRINIEGKGHARPRYSAVGEKLSRLERAVPGLHPSWGREAREGVSGCRVRGVAPMTAITERDLTHPASQWLDPPEDVEDERETLDWDGAAMANLRAIEQVIAEAQKAAMRKAMEDAVKNLTTSMKGLADGGTVAADRMSTTIRLMTTRVLLPPTVSLPSVREVLREVGLPSVVLADGRLEVPGGHRHGIVKWAVAEVGRRERRERRRYW